MNSIESLGLNETIVPANTHNDLLMIGCVHPQPGPEYFCGDCPFEGGFGEVANHRISHHKDAVFSFNRRVLSDESGKISRVAIDYKYIPRDVENHGYTLKIDEEKSTVHIVKSDLKLEKGTQTDHTTEDRCVGTSDDCTTVENELWQLLPDVCQFLAEVDAIHSTRLVQYMRLLSDRTFPMTNISYRVFLDLVQWHSLSDHTQMRYHPRVLQFWATCKTLFHTQMLEFMRGNLN